MSAPNTENQEKHSSDFPFLSVIIPVYNGVDVISDAIESILAQDYPKERYEIIVADNNSNDDTADIIKKFPVRYILANEAQGPSVARNAGAKMAKGEGLLFFDADQIADSKYVRFLIEGWDEYSYGAFSGKNVGMNRKSDVFGAYWMGEWHEAKSDDNGHELPHISGGLLLIRANIFRELRGFDTSLRTCEDIDLAWRMQKNIGKRIKYNFEAISYHKERLSLKSLINREYQFGYGRAILEERHPEIKRRIHYKFLKIIKGTFLSLLALLKKLLICMVNKHSWINVQLICLQTLLKWVNFVGYLKRRREQVIV